MLGGDISVASRVGEGSTFTIVIPDLAAELPQSEATIDLSAEPTNSQEESGSITVLIVDDDAASRDLLTTSLRREGYRTVQARGGDEALELASRLRPDAITLDVLMPKTDGWAVLGALKANPELCHIPVIMVTVAPDRGIEAYRWAQRRVIGDQAG